MRGGSGISPPGGVGGIAAGWGSSRESRLEIHRRFSLLRPLCLALAQMARLPPVQVEGAHLLPIQRKRTCRIKAGSWDAVENVHFLSEHCPLAVIHVHFLPQIYPNMAFQSLQVLLGFYYWWGKGTFLPPSLPLPVSAVANVGPERHLLVGLKCRWCAAAGVPRV